MFLQNKTQSLPTKASFDPPQRHHKTLCFTGAPFLHQLRERSHAILKELPNGHEGRDQDNPSEAEEAGEFDGRARPYGSAADQDAVHRPAEASEFSMRRA